MDVTKDRDTTDVIYSYPSPSLASWTDDDDDDDDNDDDDHYDDHDHDDDETGYSREIVKKNIA